MDEPIDDPVLLPTVRRRAAPLAAALAFGLASVGALATTQPDWAGLLRTDAQALHDALADSHPGTVNPEDPGFKALLDQGLKTALHRAPSVQSHAAYWWALKAYVATFDDGHVAIGALPAAPALPARWPGFLTGFDGDRQIVRVRADEAAPPLGAELVDCDGVPAQELARRRVGEVFGRWMLQASRDSEGGRLLLDQSNPFVPLPANCRFKTADGLREQTLAWRPLDAEEVTARLAETRRSFRPPNGLRAFASGWWITMGNFNGDPTSANHRELTALLDEVGQRLPVLRAARSVVLDLRGNTGGSSRWSELLALQLWGEACVEARRPETGQVFWRTSDANVDFLRELLRKVDASAQPDAQLQRWLRQTLSGMAQAQAQGQPLWSAHDEDERGDVVVTPGPASPMAGVKTYVLTDAGCGSACLDAVDLWKALGAVQIGRETSADTLYMDVRPQPLPSGYSRISVPMKVYRGRPRGSNETQKPTHVFSGDLRDTPAVEAWVGTLVGGGK